MKRLLIATALLAATMVVPASATPPDTCLGRPTNDDRTTDFADYLTGTPGVDIINGGDGPDQVFAAESPDVLCGGAGVDVMVGESGNDEISGGGGADTLSGLSGADEINGNAGADELQGGGGDDLLTAGADTARDDIYDGDGLDTIVSNDPGDFWHRCPDGEDDDHSDFAGTTVNEPDC